MTSDAPDAATGKPRGADTRPAGWWLLLILFILFPIILRPWWLAVISIGILMMLGLLFVRLCSTSG